MPKLVKVSPQLRMIELLIDILTCSGPIPLEHYGDAQRWGDERTFRRMRKSLNEYWVEHYGSALFEITDEFGKAKRKGDDRFIMRVDERMRVLDIGGGKG